MTSSIINNDCCCSCKTTTTTATTKQPSSSSSSSSSSLSSSVVPVQEISWSNVHIQKSIGVGSFCRVQQVHITNHEGLEDKELALKCLKTQVLLMEKSADIIQESATSDLIMEGEILSNLPTHPNIIKLHGVCCCAGEGSSSLLQQQQDDTTAAANYHNKKSNNNKGYFLVLDLLDDTFENRLAKYRRNQEGSGRRSLLSKRSSMLLSSFNNKSSSSKSSSSSTLSPIAISERIENIALGVARGLSHLHQNNIVLRDLKPDNIGFDNHGKVTIFDLGLARNINNILPNEIAGSLRYMGPEVVTKGGGYQTSSDVYSFGILLWELCTLEKPYEKFKTAESFMENVIFGDYRPSLTSIKSEILKQLIQACWDTNPALRPTMSEVVHVLQGYIICDIDTDIDDDAMQIIQTQPSRRGGDVVSLKKKREEESSSSSNSNNSNRSKATRSNSILLEKSDFSQSFSGPFELKESTEISSKVSLLNIQRRSTTTNQSSDTPKKKSNSITKFLMMKGKKFNNKATTEKARRRQH